MDNGIIGQRINKALAFRNVKRKELAKELGEKLKEIRKEHNLNQSEFGELFGLTQNTITNIENDKRVPTYEILIEIAKRFNISVDYLLGLSEAKTNDIELKAICDYTGLTEDIINTLHTQKGKIRRVLLCENMVVLEREKTNRNTIKKYLFEVEE